MKFNFDPKLYFLLLDLREKRKSGWIQVVKRKSLD
jgi:hypothetical protein